MKVKWKGVWAVCVPHNRQQQKENNMHNCGNSWCLEQSLNVP